MTRPSGPLPLRLLLLEDSDDDAALILTALCEAGFEPNCTRVDCREAFAEALEHTPEVVLADFSLPGFDALRALHMVKERGIDVPFIVVTGAMSDEAAVECMRQGASDYLLKDRLGRLGSAVERALLEQQLRREKRRAEAALRESEKRYRVVSEMTSDFSFAIWIRPDGTPVWEWATEAFNRITGYSREDAASSLLRAGLVHPDDLSAARDWWRVLLAGQESQVDLRIVTRSGEVRSLRAHARPEVDPSSGRVVRVYGAAKDVTDLLRWEEALRHQSLHDALTGLPNRVLLRDRLEHAILAAEQDVAPLTLLVLGLDRFREVNDTLGHGAGDELLRRLGQRLRERLRATDTVARLGGDEFAALIPRAGLEDGRRTAAALLRLFDTPFLVQGRSMHVRASIGLAAWPEHGPDAETLMRRADVAMYLAKRAGGGYAVYDAELDDHSPERLALVADLRRAILDDSLALYYQPKVDFTTARCNGVEALVRWQHPRLGLLSPEEFVPLAEQTDLIRPLSAWILREALRQRAAWLAEGLDLSVAVNLSARNLDDPDLPGQVADLLLRHGVDSRRLTLEITETALMADWERAADVLGRLCSLGVTLAIDDFGTGYSSLARLKRLPVQEIKIDKVFVRDMSADDNDATIVRSTIDLGHNLGLSVVAEGVEDRAAWRLLGALRCDGAQGFYVSGPLSAADLERWLRESPWGAGRGAGRALAAEPLGY